MGISCTLAVLHQSYFFQVCIFPLKNYPVLSCTLAVLHQSYFFQVLLCESSVISCLHTPLLTNIAKDALLISITGYRGYQGFGLGSSVIAPILLAYQSLPLVGEFAKGVQRGDHTP